MGVSSSFVVRWGLAGYSSIASASHINRNRSTSNYARTNWWLSRCHRKTIQVHPRHSPPARSRKRSEPPSSAAATARSAFASDARHSPPAGPAIQPPHPPRSLGHRLHRGRQRTRRLFRHRLLPRSGSRRFNSNSFCAPIRGTLSELVGRAGLARRSTVAAHRLSSRGRRAMADARRRDAGHDRGVRARRQRRRDRTVCRDGRTSSFCWAASRRRGRRWIVSAVVKLISFSLASNWDIELARLKVLLEDGPAALAALDPAYPAVAAGDGAARQASRSPRSIDWQRN